MTESFVRHEKKILTFILFLALGLRVWGIQFGLPGLFHADEPIVLNHALAYGTGDFNPHFFKIPPLVSYLLFAVFGVYYFVGHLFGQFSGTADFELLFYSDPSSFYLLARLVFGALAGTLTVFVFYSIIRKHFGVLRALTGAFLLAICFLHVSDSHYLYADIPLVLVMVLAFGLFWDIRPDSGSRKHLLAGAIIGLAVALKYNGVFIGFFYGMMLMGMGHIRWSQKAKYLILAVGAAGLIFTLLNPYWILDFNFFMEEIKKQSLSQGGVGWLHHGIYSLPGAMGMPILLAAFAGCLAVFKWKQAADAQLKRAALLVFTAGYYTVLACSGQPYPRYVLPLLPGLLFFAADFICLFTEKKQRWFFRIGLVFLALFPLTKAILWDHLMTAQDVRTQAKVWVESHLASGTSLALDWEFYMPRLNFAPEQLDKKIRGLNDTANFHSAQRRRLETLKERALKEASYGLHFLVPDPSAQERFLMASPTVPYDLEALKTLGIKYALLISGIEPGEAAAFYDQIQREGRLIRTLSPYRDGRVEPLDRITMTGGPFTWSEIVRRSRNGHTIWIYQIL